MDSTEPTITLPLSIFRELALGYKYSSYDGKEADNLRDKCVLSRRLIDILKSTQHYEKYFHIQDTGKDSLPLVWHIREWKDSGERRQVLNEKLDKDRSAADKLCVLLKNKIPAGIDGNALKALALEYIRIGADLTAFGIKKEDYMS